MDISRYTHICEQLKNQCNQNNIQFITSDISILQLLVFLQYQISQSINIIYVRPNRAKSGRYSKIEWSIDSKKQFCFLGWENSDYQDNLCYVYRSLELIEEKLDLSLFIDENDCIYKGNIEIDKDVELVLSSKNQNPYNLSKKNDILPYRDDYIYIDDRGAIILLDSAYDKKWELQIGPGNQSLFTPEIIDDLIYITSQNGNLYVLEWNTWKIIKNISLCDSIESKPVYFLEKDQLYISGSHHINMQSKYLFILDRQDFSYEEIPLQHNLTAQTAVFENTLFTADSNEYLLVEAQGNLLRFKILGQITWSFAQNWEYIYFATTLGYLYSYCLYSNSIVNYKKVSEYWILGTPLILEESIIVTSVDKKVYRLDINLNILSIIESGGRIFAWACKIDENIICFGSNDAKIYLHNYQDQITYTYQLAERIIHTPIYKNNKLVVQDFLNNIYQIDL